MAGLAWLRREAHAVQAKRKQLVGAARQPSFSELLWSGHEDVATVACDTVPRAAVDPSRIDPRPAGPQSANRMKRSAWLVRAPGNASLLAPRAAWGTSAA